MLEEGEIRTLVESKDRREGLRLGEPRRVIHWVDQRI